MSDAAMMVLAASFLALAVLSGWAWTSYRDERLSVALPEVTPVAPPTLLPENRALVVVLRTVADDIEASGERCAASLRDVARVIQISAVEPVPSPLRDRVADFVDDHAGVLKRSAQRIREAS